MMKECPSQITCEILAYGSLNGALAKACLKIVRVKHALRERHSCSYFPRYCHSSTVHPDTQERKMAPRASIMVLVLLAAFLSPSQSLALPSGACQINSGLNTGKTGTYDTKQDPGHVYC